MSNPHTLFPIRTLAAAGVVAFAAVLPRASHAEWPVAFGSLGFDEVVAVEASASGDVFIAGHFSGTLETAGGNVISQGLQDVFVARISQAGDVVWVESLGGPLQDEVADLALDTANAAYVVGTFTGTIGIGSGTQGPAGLEDGYVAKIDSQGLWKWSRAISGTGIESATSVLALPGDSGVFPPVPESVLVGGAYECNATFGQDATGSTVSLARGDCFPGRSDLFLARFEASNGSTVYAADRGAGATGFEEVTELAVNDQNQVILAGSQVVGGLQTVIDRDFNSTSGTSLPAGWSRSNSTNAITRGDPDNLLSGSRMLGLRQNQVSAISEIADTSTAQSLIIEFDAFRGANYPADFNITSSSTDVTVPCFIFSCIVRTTTLDVDYDAGAVYSYTPYFSNQWFEVQYLDRNGFWIRLGNRFPAIGPSGQQFDFQNANAFVLDDPDAFHPGFRLRFFFNGGGGQVPSFSYQCTTVETIWNGTVVASNSSCTGINYDYTDAGVPWWHVDDVRVQAVPEGQPFLLPVNDVLRESGPSFGISNDMTLGLTIGDMVIDNANDRVVITGTRSGSPALAACGTLIGSGMYVASLRFNDLGCSWAQTADGGSGVGLTVDATGNIYVTGQFTNRIDFNNDTGLNSTLDASGNPTSDAFIVSYPPSGTPLRWATGGGEVNDDDSDPNFGIPAYAGGSGSDAGLDIATDGFSTLYVAGRFESIARFGPVDSLVALQDSDGFAVNLGTDGRFFQEQAWFAGTPLTPPPNALVDNVALPPDFFVDGVSFDAIGNKIFSWTRAQGQDARLIPLQPFGSIEVHWRVQGQPPGSDARVVSLGAIAWPPEPCSDIVTSDCFQVHVVGAPVEAEPATGDYKVLEVVSPASGSSNPSNNAGQFSATQTGTASIVYVNGPTIDPLQYPTVVEVVRTLPYQAVPLFIDGVDAEIGQPITDPFHNEPNRNGFVVNELSYYDGFGPDAAYNRTGRTGPIIPVNRISRSRPQDAGRELAVAWYRANAKGVYWPAKTVRYQPRWPFDPERIIIASQFGSEVLGQQPLDPVLYPSGRIYIQNERSQPGYNPNDEHAFMAPSAIGSGVNAAFALRSDFGANLESDQAAASDPYVLYKFFDESLLEWRFRVFRVDATGAGFSEFRFNGTAATTVSPPYPVRLLPNCSETFVEGQAAGEQPPPPFFQDYSAQLWAKSAGTGAVQYYYPAQPGFFSDLDNNDVNDIVGQACVPWLARLPADQGGTPSSRDPISVTYEISWPEERPLLTSGETLLTPKRGLPDIYNQAAVEVVYDQIQETTVNPLPSDTLAQLIDPLNPRIVYLPAIPANVAKEFQSDGTEAIVGSLDGEIKLPVSIRDRLRYDPINKRLILTGLFDETGAGEPFLLLNVLSRRDRVILKTLDGGDGNEAQAYTNECLTPGSGCSWDQAIEALFRLSRNPQRIEQICLISRLDVNRNRVCEQSRAVNAGDVLIGYDDPAGNGVLVPFQASGVNPALTAGAAQGSGLMTVAFNNDPALAPLPVSLEVIEVGCLFSEGPPQIGPAPYLGQVNVLAPENIFDEQLVLRHSGDFGGDPDALEFEWFFAPDVTGSPPTEVPVPETGQLNGWIQFPVDDPQGAVEISIQGANIQTLSDNWYLTRYRGLPGCENQTEWSLWAGSPGGTAAEPLAQLAEGWVKRVLGRLNPFEARVQNFAQAATNNFASMLIQLGERYEGPIALNNDPDNLNSIGLIEAYTTVMRRALQLSVDGTPPVNYGPANNAILLVASRLVEFYTLLGNEAYADAQDPTIGITTNDGSFSLAPSIYNFQNQLASLLDEELVLLRGRDTNNGPVTASPVYNRLFWNFTQGDGEVAYQQSYNISDQNFDGVIDEFDARIMFPQGHGDAWGHYLTANKIYYDLLRHPFYTWDPRIESLLVAGVAINVDYEDERQFAKTAAAKAKAGAELVDLTYRSRYVDDPAGQYQGYTDTNAERAWGLSEWGRRAGMGAYFDWVTANSILPSEEDDPSAVGIERIDRSTIRELGEIATNYQAVQGQVDEADAGLNPLGLATGVVPFDIDPSVLDRLNKTQFEQVADRALAALENAVNVWDYANQLTNQMRRNQNEVDDLSRAANGQESDFSNQLIEIFGYPYADDIGPGGVYPAGYNGPDLYHYMYVDVPQLAGTLFDFDGGLENRNIARVKQFTGVYQPAANGINFFDMAPAPPGTPNVSNDGLPCEFDAFAAGCALGELDISAADSLEVEYTTIESPDIGLWFTKPESWTGQRRAPGRLQQILQQMLQARIALRQAMLEYDQLRLEIEAQIDTVQATFDIAQGNLNIANDTRGTLRDLTIATETMNGVATVANRAAAFLNRFASNTAECIPTLFIGGLAVGTDAAKAAACPLRLTGDVAAFTLESVADGLSIAASATDASKEDVEQLSGIRTQINDTNLDLFNTKGVIDELIRKEPLARAEVFARVEAIKQLVGDYQATLAEGLRAYDSLLTFRREGAAEVQEYRYQDMAFRIFRNDALQKYRAAFDLAARYVYLAAAAYDYETNLLGSDSQAGQQFLTDIVRQRNLGQLIGGEPMPGTPGLADSIAQLQLNFDVLKGQMGFNNPQVETNRFSLRRELFRIPDGPEGDALWRRKLEESRVDDLWTVPEFRQYARPFAPQSAGPQPALVLEFTTNVTFGLNFFGWELGSGDSSYDSSQFATRIRSVGTWFGDYADLPLAQTPRIYLFPSGADVLRAPSADDFRTREWQVVDQVIPIPFPVGQQDLERFDWLPIVDNISGSPTDIRRYGRFPAYHFTEPFDDSQVVADSRLVGRSVWNRRWLLIIPGGTFLADPEEGLETFINGQIVPGSNERDGQGVSDILIFFKTYAYSGL